MTTGELLEKDVSTLVDERKGFKYLPWATAWKMVLEIDDKAVCKVDRNPIDGLQCFGNPEMGYTVYTSLTFQGVTREMYLPVFEGKKSIKKPDSYQINTAVMRCKVKNIAEFGLGLDVYIGEDIPEEKKEKGLQSYTDADLNKNSKDPLDGPGVKAEDIQEVDNKNVVPKSKVKKKSTPKKEITEKVTPEIDKKFEKAMKDQGYSAAKIKEHLGNSKINKTIKQQVINKKLELSKK